MSPENACADSRGQEMTGDLDPQEFRRAGHQLIDWIADYLGHPERVAVLPDVEPGALADRLGPEPPLDGTEAAHLLEEFESDIFPHAVHWNHPGFMAYFASGGSTPGILGDALSTALNNVGLLWRSSPALAELEGVTLHWLAQLLGLPESWFGIIHDTASTASLHAVIAARERSKKIARQSGSDLDLNRIVIYASDQAHSSIEKVMGALGRGIDACRKVSTTPAFALRTDALREAISRDLAEGFVPIAIVATVGTTPSTGVDPVDAIADVAAEYSLWLHVDAAYAGAAAILPEKRHYFAGCERADSFVVNPHKWLFVPMDLSVLYSSRPEEYRSALSLTPEYLSSHPHPRAINYMECSIPLGRRFRALKLWYVLKALGSERISGTIREHIRIARLLAGWVDAHPSFERIAPVPFSLVCLRFQPSGASDEDADAASERMLSAVNRTGEFFLSHTVLGGRYVMRVAIGHLGTTENHVRRLWALLRNLAEKDAAA